MKGQCAKTCQHCDSIERCSSGPCLNGAACEEEGILVNNFGGTCNECEVDRRIKVLRKKY